MALTKVRAGGYDTGGIIQVQHTLYTGEFDQSISATTDTKINNLSVNITPISTSSKILLQTAIFWEGTLVDHEFLWMFFRDNTVLKAPQVGSNRRSGISIGSTAYYSDDKVSTPSSAVFQYFDSPSTTSQITYHSGVSTRTAASLFVNRSQTDSDTIDYERGISYISATEIAG